MEEQWVLGHGLISRIGLIPELARRLAPRQKENA